MILYILISLGVLGLDQVSKFWILKDLKAPLPLLPCLQFSLVWNRGISFGLFGRGSAWVFWALTVGCILAVFGLLIWMYRLKELLPRLGLAFIIGGAVGNIIDRLVHGAVVDFIDFFWKTYHWPVFNVADTFITVGVGLMMWNTLTTKDKS